MKMLYLVVFPKVGTDWQIGGVGIRGACTAVHCSVMGILDWA